ncbi:MAG: hypothetical protein IJX20_01090 [Alphaproteobacteria bacterium]|nr:hypothetical protein [Alphaproteobacteria bacterium]
MKSKITPLQPERKFFKKMSVFQKWSMLITLLIFLTATLPFTIVLLIGMLPTLTILLTDTRNNPKLIIVGCFNLAGVFVYILDIISNFSIAYAFIIVTNIFNLIIMLSSAALGLIIYSEIPNIFLFFSKISAQKRLENINNKLEKLAEEWGSDILNNQISTKDIN